ncbi:hypothetical protein GH714_016004 [Hevea brasiliensis]|uniref:Uncharacterized protein n=1 Tax=Hevea brasiliensis TaxID=3981 RepID=A0A6A6LDR3_HEVBR|nr:hypothetical protein GH714_016004 [Hevea brasiliensis]
MSEEELEIRFKRIKEFVKHQAKSSTPFRAETLVGNKLQLKENPLNSSSDSELEIMAKCLDVIEPLVQEAFELSGDDKLNVLLATIRMMEMPQLQEEISLGDELERLSRS